VPPRRRRRRRKRRRRRRKAVSRFTWLERKGMGNVEGGVNRMRLEAVSQVKITERD
jgi:hypothetical protein